MARYTPTNTPIRNYAIAFFLSVFFLYTDISHQTFAPLRGIMNASSLYVQVISKSIVQNISFTFASIRQNKYLLQENKKLREQTLQLSLKDFIEKKDNDEKTQVIDFQETLSSTFKSNGINVFKIASIDLRNYFCCSSHKVFLHNPNKIKIKKNFPVFAGNSFVGQTHKTYMNFIEVILLSDTEHVLPIKSDFFYCDARGIGKPMLISCKVNDNDFENQIGDIVLTSGLGGIFLKDVEIGFISEIFPSISDEIEVVITLKTNPLEENFYGILSSNNNEI
ncbi:MAG: rod shape-determining protein MreC [Gammaproteobacteria bacterium]